MSKKFCVGIAVNGRAYITVNARNPEEAKQKAEYAFQEFDIGNIECVDWKAINAECEDGERTDFQEKKMEERLYAFWEYDCPPYVLGGEVEELKDNGLVRIKGYRGMAFDPVKVVPYEEGIELEIQLSKQLEDYYKAVNEAKHQLKEFIKESIVNEKSF